MEADPEAELVRRYIKALGGGHATLMRASAAALASTPILQPQAEAIEALSLRIKEKFDPAGLFPAGW